jgi:lactate racemase
MAPQNIIMPWGKERIQLSLPAEWHITGHLTPAALAPVTDPLEEVRRSLEDPIDSPPLQHQLWPGMRVALVIDDSSRPTPVHLILPPVLEELQKAGVSPEDITLIPALGLHRAMTEAELAERVGADVLPNLTWRNHDCDDSESLSFLGTTQRGTPVYLNKSVANADLVISIGCIEPHIIASFGGGAKNLVPGVVGRQTVAHNHALNCHPQTFNMVGQPIEANPMRLDLEEAAEMLEPPVFIMNAVLNSDLQVVRIVSGDMITAHRAGVETSAQLYGVSIPAPADVVITDSHPMNQDLRQGVKALANTVRAVRRGGVQITLVRAEEGVGVFGLANRKLPLGKGLLRLLAPLLVALVPRLKIEGMGEEDRFFLYFALQAMRHCTLIMVAPTVPDEVRQNLPFVEFADTPEEAIREAQRRVKKSADVLIFPHGGTTYPIL